MTTALGEVRRSLGRAWQGVADGWRELVSRSGDALTRFVSQSGDRHANRRGSRGPGWGLTAAEVLETGRAVVVQVELPGVDKQDCEVRIERSTLVVRGEKRVSRDHIAEDYFLSERAYGSFQRSVPLPPNVAIDRAKATFENGVLTVELPKTSAWRSSRLKIH